MQTALRKMGNSTGMIVPKSLLTEMGLGVGAALDVRIEDGRLVATPIPGLTRAGWEEDALALSETSIPQEERDWLAVSVAGDAALKW